MKSSRASIYESLLTALLLAALCGGAFAVQGPPVTPATGEGARTSETPISEDVPFVPMPSGVESLLSIEMEDQDIAYDDDALYFLDLKSAIETAKRAGVEDKVLYDTINMVPETGLPGTGSRKCDAYTWAKALYLDKGLTNPTLMVYNHDAYSWGSAWFGGTAVSYPDLENIMVVNNDYGVSQKAFFLDLCPFPNQIPSDDRGQVAGTDFSTFSAILKKQNQTAQW